MVFAEGTNLILFLLVMWLVTWIVSMQLITEAAKRKGYDNITGRLWLIGFFGLAFTPALIVIALPEKNNSTEIETEKSVENELPEP